jgi:hypothetical protein
MWVLSDDSCIYSSSSLIINISLIIQLFSRLFSATQHVTLCVILLFFHCSLYRLCFLCDDVNEKRKTHNRIQVVAIKNIKRYRNKISILPFDRHHHHHNMTLNCRNNNMRRSIKKGLHIKKNIISCGAFKNSSKGIKK